MDRTHVAKEGAEAAPSLRGLQEKLLREGGWAAVVWMLFGVGCLIFDIYQKSTVQLTHIVALSIYLSFALLVVRLIRGLPTSKYLMWSHILLMILLPLFFTF